MAFAILGGISAAIAEAATAALVGTGLGTAAGAGATAGLLGAGATGALASGIGAVGTGALAGAGLGAAGSAITGGDPGKGALMGAAGGALTGGLGSAFGGAGGAAGGSGGSFGGVGVSGGISDATNPIAQEAFGAGNILGQGSPLATAPVPTGGWAPASGSILATPTETAGGLTSNIGQQFTQGIGSNIAGAGTTASEGLGGALTSGITNLVKESAPSVALQGLQAIPMGGGQGPSAEELAAQEKRKTEDAQRLGSQVYGLAAGGGVDLHDGDFIIPADVLSDLGNGSTKAGAQFLDEFFGLA